MNGTAKEHPSSKRSATGSDRKPAKKRREPGRGSKDISWKGEVSRRRSQWGELIGRKGMYFFKKSLIRKVERQEKTKGGGSPGK